MQQAQRGKEDKNSSQPPTIVNVGQWGVDEAKASECHHIQQSPLMAYKLPWKEHGQ